MLNKLVKIIWPEDSTVDQDGGTKTRLFSYPKQPKSQTEYMK